MPTRAQTRARDGTYSVLSDSSTRTNPSLVPEQLAAPAKAKPSRKTAKVAAPRQSKSIPNLIAAAAAHVAKSTQIRRSLDDRNIRDEASNSNDAPDSPEMVLGHSQPRHEVSYDDELTDDDEGKSVLFSSSTFANSRS